MLERRQLSRGTETVGQWDVRTEAVKQCDGGRWDSGMVGRGQLSDSEGSSS